MRILLLSGFLTLVAAALWVAPADAQPGTLKEIVPGVWFRQAEAGSNSVIVEMKDYLLVVDANFPNGARAVLAGAKKVSSKPVKYVFLTHHHGDHAYGLPVFAEAGASVIAHQGVVEEMKAREPRGWQEAAKRREDIAGLKLPGPGRIQRTFKDRLQFGDGARQVEFRFFGWAHTSGDGWAYLPKEKVLCTGDAVVNGPNNFLGDAHIANWPDVIRSAQKLDVAHLLPGHGPAGGKELMEGQAKFLAEIYDGVRAAIKRGVKPDELASAVKLSDSVSNWVGKGLPNQLQLTYEEITQGKPHGEITRPK